MSNLLEQASLVMIPSGYKEDVVYSEIPLDGSGDMTFTRASDGTRINSQGLVEVVPWNLVQNSENFDAVWTKYNGATVTVNAITAPNGTTTADLLIAGATQEVYSANMSKVAEELYYTFSCYAKLYNTNVFKITASDFSTSGVDGSFNLSTVTATYVTGATWSNSSASIESVGNGWYRCILTSKTPATTGLYLSLYTSGTNSVSGVYIWGAQVNIGSTAKPYFPTTDRLNVPRLTYQNGGGGCPSLLLEKQSTNLVTYSEQFDATASWSYSECSVTANQTTSPDGTQNADKLVENSANTIHEIYQGLTLTGGTTYTNTIYAKSAERTQIAINFVSGGFGQGSQVIANLSDGTLGTITNYGGVTGSTATITNVGDGWYRISLTMTPVSTTTFYADYSPAVNGNAFYQGNGTSGIYIYGAQIEASSYATSYIPTTSSSATRVADACYKTGISSLIGQTEGTIFVDFVVNGQTTAPNAVNIYNNDYSALTTSTNAITYSDGLISCFTFRGNGTYGTININASGYTIGERIKLAYRYKSGDFAFYINGVQKGTSSATLTFNGTKSEIYLNALNVYYGYPDAVQYNQFVQFATALTNAELQALTA